MESGSHLGAGSVLYPDQRVPHGEVCIHKPSSVECSYHFKLWAGSPAKFVRKLSEDEIEATKVLSDYYWRLSTRHQDEFYLSELLHYEAQEKGIEVGVHGVHKDRKWGLL